MLTMLALARLQQAAEPNPRSVIPVPICEGGVCLGPLWFRLLEGETAISIRHLDAGEIRVRSPRGQTITVFAAAGGLAVSLFSNGDSADLRADGEARWQVRRRNGTVE